MKVRRYFAANMRSALELVRQEQGPDVLILSNRKVDGGVELLTASGEADPELIEKFTPKPTRARGTAAAPAAAAAPPTSARAAAKPDAELWTRQETIDQMQRELGALKNLLEHQLSGFAWHDYSQRSPLGARLLRALSEYGIAPRLARSVVGEIGDTGDYEEAWRRALAALRRRVVCLSDPVLRHGGHYALCGTTGVGKTSLASKLAGRYALARGSRAVALVSTDEQRLGAHHQLRTFGRLVGITVRCARSFEELPEMLAELHDRELVIVDMPGFAPGDPGFRESLATLYGLPTRVETYLVMAASTDHQSFARIVAAADGLALGGCCITKIDEAATLGAALSAAAEAQLPVAYLARGQQVPDDVEAASPAALLEQFITMGKACPAPVDPAFIEQAFAQ